MDLSAIETLLNRKHLEEFISKSTLHHSPLISCPVGVDNHNVNEQVVSESDNENDEATRKKKNRKKKINPGRPRLGMDELQKKLKRNSNDLYYKKRRINELAEENLELKRIIEYNIQQEERNSVAFPIVEDFDSAINKVRNIGNRRKAFATDLYKEICIIAAKLLKKRKQKSSIERDNNLRTTLQRALIDIVSTFTNNDENRNHLFSIIREDLVGLALKQNHETFAFQDYDRDDLMDEQISDDIIAHVTGHGIARI